jgi:hypothetical protein
MLPRSKEMGEANGITKKKRTKYNLCEQTFPMGRSFMDLRPCCSTGGSYSGK